MKKARYEEIKAQLEGAKQDLAAGDEDQIADSLADMIKAVEDLLPEVSVEEYRFGDSVRVVKDNSGAWQQFVGRLGRIQSVEPGREYPLTVRLEGSNFDIRAHYSEIEKIK